MVLTTKELVSFCKKKGFMYASSEIYGGVAGLYDYGHLGTLLKKNFENNWRNFFLGLHDNFHEIETANIMHEKVFEASGHLANFMDPLAKCTKCGNIERADHLVEKELGERFEGLSIEEYTKLIRKNDLKCPKCKAEFEDVTVLNLMFPLKMGVSDSNLSYLRPETAQSPYVNFKLQFNLLRKKLPMGLALVGRAYRNEISPRNFTLRQREFTQAELQIFFNPNKIKEHPDFESVKDVKLNVLLVEDRGTGNFVKKTVSELVKKGFPKFYVYHLAKIQEFYFQVMGVPVNVFRFYQLDDNEKAFYNKYHFDLEIDLAEHGFTEVGGLHYRTDHDLVGHQKVSGEKMTVIDETNGEKVIPHVLELSFGVDRNVYTLVDAFYNDDKERGNTVLNFPKKMAPFFCAVFPLVKNKPDIVAKAQEIYKDLKGGFSCYYDQASSVGRRYARADEMGVCYSVVVDFESLEDGCVTIRDRDTTKQERVKVSELKNRLFELYTG